MNDITYIYIIIYYIKYYIYTIHFPCPAISAGLHAAKVVEKRPPCPSRCWPSEFSRCTSINHINPKRPLCIHQQAPKPRAAVDTQASECRRSSVPSLGRSWPSNGCTHLLRDGGRGHQRDARSDVRLVGRIMVPRMGSDMGVRTTPWEDINLPQFSVGCPTGRFQDSFLMNAHCSSYRYKFLSNADCLMGECFRVPPPKKRTCGKGFPLV